MENLGEYSIDRSPRRSCGATLLNFLSLLLILGTLFLGGVFLALYVNPELPFNPFPPPQETRVPTTPTPGSGSPTLPPAETATMTSTPTATPTHTPTPLPSTSTPVVVLPSPTPLPYTLQPETPLFTQNFLNDLACAWMGVAGQVFGSEGSPVVDTWVKLGGELAGTPLDLLSLPGSAPGYGEGGYEFKLSDEPIASQGTVWIQLVDPEGNPMSEKTFLTTSDKCEENLILVKWVRSP